MGFGVVLGTLVLSLLGTRDLSPSSGFRARR